MKTLGPRYGSAIKKLSYWWKTRNRPSQPIVVTHCGKLGDFIACLPVASWLYKTHGDKIHFVLAKSFGPFSQIDSLLMLQEMTHKVTLVDFPVVDWEKGGEPYVHDPNQFGVVTSEYYNLGFRRTPRRFVPEYVAEEHGLGYDPEFKLNLGDYPFTDEILVGDEHMLVEVPHAQVLDLSQDILTNARRMAGARESHVSQSGLFHVLDWAGVTPTRVYIYPHSVNIHLFTRRLHEFEIVNVQRDVRPRN
ncbi:MAG: hypothetical protein KDB65_11540 [Calditrichaeota bacterium]|nr:hypothetical protein [Calditrichota bacterium]MCB9367859.1 hypothetical protein [Calditrichota bacterium]